MALPSVTHTFVTGTTIDAAEVNTNFSDLINSLTDGSKDITTNAVTTTATVTVGSTLTAAAATVTGTLTAPGMPPVGSIIPWYDFNAALSFNATYWAYCDGSVATVSGAGSVTLPDLSNRYLIGFGTEGGGDIDSAAWATAAVGNANHQADATHTHGVGSYKFQTGNYDADGGGAGIDQFEMFDTSGSTIVVAQKQAGTLQVGATSLSWFGNPTSPAADTALYTKSGSGSSASGGSATQDIQPRSIRVRFIMRIL